MNPMSGKHHMNLFAKD